MRFACGRPAQDAAGAVDDDESGAGELYKRSPMRCNSGVPLFFEGGNLPGRRREGEAELLRQR